MNDVSPALPAIVCLALLCFVLAALAPEASAATTRQLIVTLAARQIGYQEGGSYCTKFGPCEEWCSLFVTWVWQRAGVPVPRLAFTGYLYDWALDATSVKGPTSVPSPGDAVLFGTGPSSSRTSRHVGIVEAVFPGYLVTIEGDSLHAVRRFVVPVRSPQTIGEPGPIYAYAAPVRGTEMIRHPARATGVAPIAAHLAALTTLAHPARAPSAQQRRLLRAIAALRAFQHMPYHASDVRIDWTGVDRWGRVDVRLSTARPMSYARRAWRRFLHQWDDAGRAYVVSFRAPPDPPVDTSAPKISGQPVPGGLLTESHGQWANAPTSYAYQWEDCDPGGGTCTPIGGASAPTYTVTGADVGHTLRVQEVARNGGGAAPPATSAPTAVVTAPAATT